MKPFYLSLAVFALLAGIFGYLKWQEFELKIASLTKEANDYRSQTAGLSYELTKLKEYYYAANNNLMISSQRERTSVPFANALSETSIVSELLATQSATIETWEYKGKKQKEFQTTIPPYDNSSYALLLLHETPEFYQKTGCYNSKTNPYYTLCQVKELNPRELLNKGKTKHNIPYYETITGPKGNQTYTTFLQIPQYDSGYLTIQLTYTGANTTAEYKQFINLREELRLRE